MNTDSQRITTLVTISVAPPGGGTVTLRKNEMIYFFTSKFVKLITIM